MVLTNSLGEDTKMFNGCKRPERVKLFMERIEYGKFPSAERVEERG